MITVPSNVLLARMAPGTSLCGLTFTATRMEVALASHPLGGHLPDLVHSGNVLSPERLLHLAKTKEASSHVLTGWHGPASAAQLTKGSVLCRLEVFSWAGLRYTGACLVSCLQLCPAAVWLCSNLDKGRVLPAEQMD